MKETKLLGSLLPSHPDAIPIIEKIREKYQLPEISPDDDPITEIYLGDEIIPLEVFRQDIENIIQESDFFITPESDLYKIYKNAKLYKDKPPKLEGWAKLLPKDAKNKLLELYQAVIKMTDLLVQMIDQQHKAIANMFYIYLLTGESEEAPNDWFSKVATMNIDGETVIMAMASQVADPEIIIQQFREQYKKTFGSRNPKVSDAVVSTAHFLRLRKMGKPWNYIVEEFIRLNKFKLPRDKTSKRYLETHQRYERLLRKRINRSEIVLKVLLKDIETKKT
jgi:hypothetical protein